MTSANDVAGLCAGPCVICGGTNYRLSCGGPTICPKCDCGQFDAATVLQQAKVIAGLRSDLESQANALREMEAERDVLKNGTRTAYSAMTKAIKLCQIDLKNEDWQNENESRRDLRLAIFRELDMPLAIVGNTERGDGGREVDIASRIITAESDRKRRPSPTRLLK